MSAVKNKPLSRQMKWQIESVKAGKCRLCAQPRIDKYHCERHAKIHKARCRNRYRKKAGIPLEAPIRKWHTKSARERLSKRQRNLLDALKNGVQCFWFQAGGYYVRNDHHDRCSASLGVLVRMGLVKALDEGEHPRYGARREELAEVEGRLG